MSTEKKDISQYIHYYLGCECMVDGRKGTIEGVSTRNAGCSGDNPLIYFEDGDVSAGETDIEDVKPILYRLEDITEEDAIELVKLSAWKQYGEHPHGRVYTTYKNPFGQIVVSWGDGLREKKVPASKEVFSPEEFNFLIKKGYWLFGSDWFDEGLIIDRKTLKQ